MTELQVIARHTMTAGKEQEVLALLPKLLQASRAEPGNVSFVAYRQLDDERSYVLLSATHPGKPPPPTGKPHTSPSWSLARSCPGSTAAPSRPST